MKNPIFEVLTAEQSSQIRGALSAALPNGLEGDFNGEEIVKRNDEYLVPIHTKQYPSEMFEFMRSLAAAEISLRDAGLKVRLVPDIRQRMIVVATVPKRGAFAYRSSDGTEYSDLALLLGIDEGSLAGTGIEGFPYDSEHDFSLAMAEAKEAYPSVDFSGVLYG